MVKGDRVSVKREIKFRAWDADWFGGVVEKVIPKMEFFKLGDTLGGYTNIYDIDISGRDANVTVMQYTGLKDKNGVEIYESDQVKTPAGIGVVKWDRCFCLFWNDRDFTTLHDCAEEQLEVIGNILENPELLKEQS